MNAQLDTGMKAVQKLIVIQSGLAFAKQLLLYTVLFSRGNFQIMTHELILKRENGDKAKIVASVYSDNYREEKAVFRVDVLTQLKAKRSPAHSGNDYTWRAINMNERYEYQMNIYLQYVSKAKILQAKVQLWEMLRPE